MDSLAHSWLTLQCNQITEVVAGYMCWGEEYGKKLRVITRWPDAGELKPEADAVGRQCVRTQSVVEKRFEGHWLLAVPLLLKGAVKGCILVEITDRSEPNRQAVTRLLQWGISWLELLLRERSDKGAQSSPSHIPFSLVNKALAAPSSHVLAHQVVTELASFLGYSRVSLGVVDRGQMKLLGLSHQAQFDTRSALVQQIQEAMEEAADQKITVTYPDKLMADRITLAHKELIKHQGGRWIATYPLFYEDEVVAAMTLESKMPLSSEGRKVCEQLAKGLGLVVRMKLQLERSLLSVFVDQCRAVLSRFIGKGHLKTKLVTALTVVFLGYLLLAEQNYRIAAKAVLEGTVQQVLVSPLNGYIVAAGARAGDEVQKGGVLGALDDKELRLERLKWASQRQQYLKEYNSALGSYDRAQVNILKAQITQAEAQLELVDLQPALI